MQVPLAMDEISIRPAREEDLPGIFAIYNHAILHSTATFDTEPKDAQAQLCWFQKHRPPYPIFVASAPKVLGWASLSEWSERCAYRTTAENSVYVHADAQGQGLGRQLMEAVLKAGKAEGIHTVIARIADQNQASVALHRGLGFETIGVMREVGFKFGKRLDVLMMQLMLG